MAASLRDWRQWRISETPFLHPLSRHALGPPTSFRREDMTAGGAETSLLSRKLGHCAHIKQWSPHHGGPRWRRLWRRLDINGTSLVYYTQQYADGRIMRYQRTSSCTVIFWLVFFSFSFFFFYSAVYLIRIPISFHHVKTIFPGVHTNTDRTGGNNNYKSKWVKIFTMHQKPKPKTKPKTKKKHLFNND